MRRADQFCSQPLLQKPLKLVKSMKLLFFDLLGAFFSSDEFKLLL
jgi:hypothetical protein